MFILYKKRNFSELINDTFSFFRVTGKNYFKTYLVFNGGLLLALVLLCYLVGQVFIEAMFSSFGAQEPNRLADEYFASNMGFFAATGLFAVLLLFIITLLSYSFPVIYMKLMETHDSPSAAELLTAFKARAGRIVVFGLLWLVTFLPISLLLGALSMLLFVIIIGIPFVLIIFAGVWCWMCLAFFDYLSTNNSYFTAMRNGWTMLFSNFWHYAGVTVIFYIIVTVVHSMISFIPYFFGIFSLVTDGMNEGAAQQETMSFFGLMMLITLILSILFSYLLGNILFVNQGIIYYSARDTKENQSLHHEIDLIGTDSE